MREEIDYVFCALYMFGLGRAVSWHRQDCNRQGILDFGRHNKRSSPSGIFPEFVYFTINF